MILANHNIEDLTVKRSQPFYGRTQSGYGRKLPTQWMVKLPGSNRWRRVYCCIYSNIGTCYVTKGSDWIVIT